MRVCSVDNRLGLLHGFVVFLTFCDHKSRLQKGLERLRTKNLLFFATRSPAEVSYLRAVAEELTGPPQTFLVHNPQRRVAGQFPPDRRTRAAETFLVFAALFLFAANDPKVLAAGSHGLFAKSTTIRQRQERSGSSPRPDRPDRSWRGPAARSRHRSASNRVRLRAQPPRPRSDRARSEPG